MPPGRGGGWLRQILVASLAATDRIMSRFISSPAASHSTISAGDIRFTAVSSCFHDRGRTNKAAVASIEARE
jgi:hypothetical protein